MPATVSLALGPAASFSAFAPGVDRTYDATTTADVVSTAGEAALSASGPVHLTNGAFSSKDPLVVEKTRRGRSHRRGDAFAAAYRARPDAVAAAEHACRIAAASVGVLGAMEGLVSRP